MCISVNSAFHADVRRASRYVTSLILPNDRPSNSRTASAYLCLYCQWKLVLSLPPGFKVHLIKRQTVKHYLRIGHETRRSTIAVLQNAGRYYHYHNGSFNICTFTAHFVFSIVIMVYHLGIDLSFYIRL